MLIFIAVLVLSIILTMLITFVRSMGVAWIILWFAQYDVWWSNVRMRPSGGHINMYTKGRQPGGDFALAVSGHLPEWDYDPISGNHYRKGTPEHVNSFLVNPKLSESWVDEKLREIGVVKVGFFRRYYKRHREWTVLSTPSVSRGSTHQYEVIKKETKEGEEHIFYFSTTVAIDLETIPTKDNYPAQMKVVENLLLINPAKAEFQAGKWEVQGVVATRSRAREYIARKGITELKEERDEEKVDDFVDHILKANFKHKDESGTVGLVPEYGVMIQGPYFVDFDLESGDQEMTDAMKRQMIAKEDIKTAEFRVAEAKLKGAAKGEERLAEVPGIKAEFEARMSVPEGADLSWAEAVKHASPKYLSLGREGRSGIMVGVAEEKE